MDINVIAYIFKVRTYYMIYRVIKTDEADTYKIAKLNLIISYYYYRLYRHEIKQEARYWL